MVIHGKTYIHIFWIKGSHVIGLLTSVSIVSIGMWYQQVAVLYLTNLERESYMFLVQTLYIWHLVIPLSTECYCFFTIITMDNYILVYNIIHFLVQVQVQLGILYHYLYFTDIMCLIMFVQM